MSKYNGNIKGYNKITDPSTGGSGEGGGASSEELALIQKQLDEINKTLEVDDVLYDTLQEVVNKLKESLDTINTQNDDINTIKTILSSDDVDLDSLQEIVDRLKEIESTEITALLDELSEISTRLDSEFIQSIDLSENDTHTILTLKAPDDSVLGTVEIPKPKERLIKFKNDELIDGIINIKHDLNKEYLNITIYDNLKEVIFPDHIKLIDLNNISVDISSFVPLEGGYAILIS